MGSEGGSDVAEQSSSAASFVQTRALGRHGGTFFLDVRRWRLRLAVGAPLHAAARGPARDRVFELRSTVGSHPGLQNGGFKEESRGRPGGRRPRGVSLEPTVWLLNFTLSPFRYPADGSSIQASTTAILPPAERGILCLPYFQWSCRGICSYSGLRRSLQLLGTCALPRSWVWTANVGVFPRVFHTELALHLPACASWQNWLLVFAEQDS